MHQQLQIGSVKVFYTGPVINAEMLVTMLEKHGIAPTFELDDAAAAQSEDLSLPARVFVPEPLFDRAWTLFYAGREDEL